MQDYHQLEIWSRAMDYAVSVYELAAVLAFNETLHPRPPNQVPGRF